MTKRLISSMLKQVMKDQGVTHAELASRLGISRQAVGNFLKSDNPETRMKTIIRYTTALNCNVEFKMLEPTGRLPLYEEQELA